MTIDCAFFGFLAADAEARTSQAGKSWTRLRVGVGQGEAIQWVSVAVFGNAASAAAELRKGDRVYVEGGLKIDTWHDQSGAERHGLSVAAFKVAKTHNIGRNRPKDAARVSVAGGTIRQSSSAIADAARTQFYSDAIPF